MVEPGWRPAVFVMTTDAIKSKTPVMRIVAPMTGMAILQGHCKITQPARVRVAFYTRKPGMPANDLERELVMIEVGDKTVHAVMTIQTGGTKRQRMRRRESQVHLTMARVASLQIEPGYIVRVTIGTDERLTRDLELVPLQGKSQRLVRERRTVHLRQAGGCPAMFGVTKPAAQIRLTGQHRAVDGRHILHLKRDLPVTIHTSVFHPRRFPGRGMAGFTVPTGLCMRRNAAQHLPALRVQWTRVIQQSALGIDITDNQERRDDRCNDPGPRQTA